jgi:hypothetical protein
VHSSSRGPLWLEYKVGRWVPMFPNAKFVSKAGYEHWRGAAGKEGINLMYIDHTRSFGD